VIAYVILIGLVAAERVAELVVSQRNLATSKARGGSEFGGGHYPAMVVLHTALLASCLIEVLTLHRPFIAALGWPKSATFRTIDLVGLDILGHVVSNMTENVRDERSDLQLPDFFRQMLERKWLGDKTKGGFYKKGAAGKEEERLALDWKTLEYHPRITHRTKSPKRGAFPCIRMPTRKMRPAA